MLADLFRNIVGKKYLLSVLRKNADVWVAALAVSFEKKCWSEILCTLLHLEDTHRQFTIMWQRKLNKTLVACMRACL